MVRTSSASLLRGLVVATLATLAGGVVPLAAQAPVWPEAVASRARELVAEAWEISDAAIALDWGPATRVSDGSLESVQLLGSGRDGHWVARVTFVGQSPVSVRLRAGYRTTRAVAARRLERGDVLNPADIEWTEWTVWDEPNRRPVPVAQDGWVAHRTIDAGVPLEEPAVRPPLAVASGDPVEVWWRRGAVGVRVVATASGSGFVGDRVYVRTDEGTRLQGVVVAPGVVNIIQGPTEGSPGVQS
jgi:flagella basal body P-ring formation protein FlgA